MTLWNFTVDDASPYLSYSPYGDGFPGSSSGWRTWYTLSGFSNVRDQASRGDSYHITSSSNASVTLQFIGTGVALFGFTDSSFDVMIDDSPRTTINFFNNSSSLLYSTYGLTNGLHSVTLSAQPTQVANTTRTLAFDFAVASIPLDSDENPPSPLFYASSDTASLLYSGAWTAGQQDGVPNATTSAPYHQTGQVGASVSFSFTGANAVAVKGLVTSDNGVYSVTMDGSTSTFNGSSLWIIPDALLYFRAGLDANSVHQLNITNLSSRLCLNSITVFQHESKNATYPNPVHTPVTTPRSHSTTKVGVILGVVLGCLIFATIGIFLSYRQRKNRQNARCKIGRPSLFRKLTFGKPEHGPSSPHSQYPSTIISPMLATLRHGSQPTSDARSTHKSSIAHSSTTLLDPASRSGRRSVRSDSLNEAWSSKTMSGQTSFLGAWDRTRTNPSPATVSRTGSVADQQSSNSVDSVTKPSDAHRTRTRGATQTVANASARESGSPRRGLAPAPDYIHMSPRKPLPSIPVPSYDAALLAPGLSCDEIKYIELDGDDHGLDRYHTAPPRYERW
ncbi:hypothetical protein LshimejAT787_0300490 [Lyophyllum shimeji]|uniref:Transmembrane protein n=1 Tax=Lyophyllum shimeji TaxID=47721 RepID=A0A9P3PHV9_LYOSH|nr:hypothetical protein LshimejAT787_0300490 [Lyophyllum shimeji]